jgi:formylglycine-generating enzyme required for sulfatase activity
MTRWKLVTFAAICLPVTPLMLPEVRADKGGPGDKDKLIAAMRFVKVPKGTFWMGGASDKPPPRQVVIHKDFELAAYTVTQEQWQAVMGNNPSHFSRQGEGKDAVKDVPDADLKRFPVECVSWDDAQAFIKKLNEREKGRGWVYRLPTEGEWEYACRGGATSKEVCSFDFYFARPTNDLSSVQANFYGDFPAGKAAKGPTLGRTAKVGSYAPNKLGLYDMHGNVWQWCANPDGGATGRAMRGGSWCVTGKGCRAAHRAAGPAPTARHNDMGLRLARVATGPARGQGFELKCRPSGQANFAKARTFGVEVYRQDKGRALYVTETGALAVGGIGNTDSDRPRPPTWLHRLDLKVRPPGFEPPPKAFGVEVYRDERNGNRLYVCETGALGVVSGAGPLAPKPVKAAWLHGLELKVRKAGQEAFDKDTPAWGIEVFLDENGRNLVYLCDSGMLAVVPAARNTSAPTAIARPAVWLYSCTLKVRKASRRPVQFATFGVEVYRDENNGNFIYLSQTGSLAVVPGKGTGKVPFGRPKPPGLTHQLELKCHKAGEIERGSLAFGIAVFADVNSDCTVYLSEKGAIAAVTGSARRLR